MRLTHLARNKPKHVTHAVADFGCIILGRLAITRGKSIIAQNVEANTQ